MRPEYKWRIPVDEELEVFKKFLANSSEHERYNGFNQLDSDYRTDLEETAEIMGMETPEITQYDIDLISDEGRKVSDSLFHLRENGVDVFGGYRELIERFDFSENHQDQSLTHSVLNRIRPYY